MGPGQDTPAKLGLIVRQVLKAGEEPEAPLAPGETVKVVTGGPVPAFAAAVIPEEQVRLQGGRVFFTGARPPGSNLKMTGEDFQKGEVVARPGTRLTPGLIGALAAMGQSRVTVYRRPRVAIVSFGRELVPARETPATGQTRDSNGPLVAALVVRDGGEIAGVEILGDDGQSEDRERLERLLSQSDLLLTIGGTSHETGRPGAVDPAPTGNRGAFLGCPDQTRQPQRRWNVQEKAGGCPVRKPGGLCGRLRTPGVTRAQGLSRA